VGTDWAQKANSSLAAQIVPDMNPKDDKKMHRNGRSKKVRSLTLKKIN